MASKATISLRLFLLVACFHTISARNAMYYNHWQMPTHQASAHRSRRSRLSSNYAAASFVARKKKKVPLRNPEPVAEVTPQIPVVTFDDLSPIGKVVAGATQIAVTTVLEYASGFFSGLFLGSAVGLPGLLFRPIEPGVPQMFMTEMKGRLVRMNSRSLTWAKGWGGISAAFGGFKIAVRVIRNGKEDEWNQILSSAAAGAFFARGGELGGVCTYCLQC
jgi:hypothetical protein